VSRAANDEHVVVAGLLRRAGRALLVHRSPSRRWYPDVWDLPGGHVEPGEVPQRALERELAEELGVTTTVTGGPSARVRGEDFVLDVWVLDEWDGHPAVHDPDEHDGLAWLTAVEMAALRLADPRLQQLVRAALRESPLRRLDDERPGRADVGRLHHVELWVPDLPRATRSWGWLLMELGYEPYQEWPGGRSWRQPPTYLVMEQSPAMQPGGHERTRPGLNHLAFHAGLRERVDALVRAAPDHGWTLLFPDRYPHAGGAQHYAAYLSDADGFEVELVADDGLPPTPPPTSRCTGSLTDVGR
jgi:8-oxo-dGTP pyrophosphatase MutT (NUDIX family)/catechol 2,3-dioxygenase-like lactoylglutathione lyase family enzyme